MFCLVAGIRKTMRNILTFHFWTFQYMFQHLGWEKTQCPSNFKGNNYCNLDEIQSNLRDVSLMSYMFLWVKNLI